MLKVDSSRGLIVGLMIVTGVGAGGIINSEIITAQASVKYELYVPESVANIKINLLFLTCETCIL
jgi:hypothetical protein